jgi:membrane-associated phospholipid phosphatase
MGKAMTDAGIRLRNRASSFPIVRRWRQLTIALLLGCFCSLAVAISLDSQPYFGWDLAVTGELQSASWPGFDVLMRGVSMPGDDVLWSGLLVGAAIVLLFAVRARREALVLLLAVGTGQVVKIAVKHIVGRPRPSPDQVNVLIHAKEMNSFPSGHTVHDVVFFGFLWFLAFTQLRRRGLRLAMLGLLAGMMLLVGPARIYLGAHWASDVLGGYLLGAALLLGSISLYRWRFDPKSKA